MDHQKVKELQDMKQKDWRSKLFLLMLSLEQNYDLGRGISSCPVN